VSEIVPEAQSASRTFAVKVTGPCPPGVYSGMFGRLLIPLGDEDVLVIPRAAVRRVGQLDIVDVAEPAGGAPDGKGRLVLRRRIVQLGRDFDDQVQVLSGLRVDEQVALAQAAEKQAGQT
jgi:multidrug efflux pump subunit AcrA (membrane-fusion protein)